MMTFMRIILLVVLIGCTTTSFAGIEILNKRVSGDEIHVDATCVDYTDNTTLHLQDNKLNAMLLPGSGWESVFTNARFQSYVRVGVDWGNQTFHEEFQQRITLNVKAYSYNNGLVLVADEVLVFTVGFDNALNYRELEMRDFPACSLAVEVIEIENLIGTPGNVCEAHEAIYIETEIETERYYPIGLGGVQTTPEHHFYFAETDELEVHWPFIPGAEQYDLEWTFVNDYGRSLSDPTMTFDFTNNATRVTVSGNAFRIPLLYESGYLIYRFRGVGRSGDDFSQPEPGMWHHMTSGSIAGYPYRFHYDGGLDNDKNWQQTTHFSENGKNKSVLSYFDGSQRSRQSLTRIGTSGNIIVGESIYDHQGRVAVNVMPVPSVGTDFAYRQDFNLFNDNGLTIGKYSRQHFDLDGGSGCPIEYLPMSATVGASQYYSEENPWLSSGERMFDYIPDADEYPFSLTRFEPDNTGRPSEVFGPGPKVDNGTNQFFKSTKYHYSVPDQIELDRLFGTEVGYKKHYSKQVVVDPNSQVTVSYVDMHGRTIATAMAGANPDNLDELKDNAGNPVISASSITVELIPSEAESEQPDPLMRTVSAQRFIPQESTSVTLNASVDGATYVPACENELTPSDWGYDIGYDYELSMADACNRIVEAAVPVQYNLSSVPGMTLNDVGEDDVFVLESQPRSFATTLDLGSYKVSKDLVVNPDIMESYLQQYLVEAEEYGCILGETDFTFTFEDPCAGYYDDCDECKESINNIFSELCECSVGSELQSWLDHEDHEAQSEAYEQAILDCDAFCPKFRTLCEVKHSLLLGDMRVHGQYGEYDMNGVVANADAYPLSIFNDNSLLLPDETTWHTILAGETGIALYDDAGLPISDPLSEVTLTHLVTQWMDEWAVHLVPFHPEYCYYDQYCLIKYDGEDVDEVVDDLRIMDDSDETNFTSDEFDKHLMALRFDGTDWVESGLESEHSIDPNFLISPFRDIQGTPWDCQTEDPFFQAWPEFVPPVSLCLESNLYRMIMELRLGAYFHDDCGNPSSGCASFDFGGANWSSDRYLSLWEMAIYLEFGGSSLNSFAAISAQLDEIYAIKSGTFTLPAHPALLISDIGVLDDLSPEERNRVWERYRGMYLSEKQRLQEVVMNTIARENGCFSGCVGQEGSLIGPSADEEFSDADSYYFVNADNPPIPNTCSFPNHYLLWSKMRRFGGDFYNSDDVGDEESANTQEGFAAQQAVTQEFADQQENQVDFEVHHNTGQCPMALDLQIMLMEITDDGNLLEDDTEMQGLGGFTQDWYEAIGGSPSSYTQLFWEVLSSSTSLSIKIHDGTSAYAFINLDDIVDEHINWEDVTGFTDLFATGVNTFNVKVWYGGAPYSTSASSEVVGGSVCSGCTPCPACNTLDLLNCSFNDVCTIDPVVQGLFNFMGLLTANGNLLETSVDIDQDPVYSSVYSTFLASYLGSATTDAVEWEYNSAGTPPTFTLSNGGNVIVLSLSDQLPTPLVLLSNFIADTDPGDIGEFSFDATDDEDVTETIVATVTYSLVSLVSDEPMVLVSCQQPIPLSCQTPEHRNRDDLESMLNSLAATSDLVTGTEHLLLLPSVITSGLVQATTNAADCPTDGGHVMIDGEAYENRLAILIYRDDESTAGCRCQIQMNSDTEIDFENVVSFSDLHPVGSMVNGHAYNFSVVAHITGGATQVLHGTSCIPIKSCEDCQAGTELAVAPDGTNWFNGFGGETPFYLSGSSRVWLDESEEDQCLLNGQYCIVGNNDLSAYHCPTYEVDGYDVDGDHPYPYVGTDHTSTIVGSSQFMIVEAEGSRRVFAQVIENLENNVDYTFSLWYMDALDDYFSSVTYDATVSLIIRALPTSGTPPPVEVITTAITRQPGVWKNLEGSWNSGALNDAIIRIEVWVESAEANEALAFDDVSFYRTCVPYAPIMTQNISLPEPQPNFGCLEMMDGLEATNAQQDYAAYLQQVSEAFRANYIAAAFDPASGYEESLTLTYSEPEYHYTLYYYDQAGNLVKTVPPEGVVLLSGTDLAAVPSKRNTWDPTDPDNLVVNVKVPSHTKETVYTYNSLNQLISQTTPDTRSAERPYEDANEDGISDPNNASRFWYDRLGRIVASQNPQQDEENKFTFTTYDALGRVYFTGLVHLFVDPSFKDISELTRPQVYDYINDEAFPLVSSPFSAFLQIDEMTDITSTYYDQQYFDIPFDQDNLRMRVASVAYFKDALDFINDDYQHATHYSYDPHGNVDRLVQDFTELQRLKRYHEIRYQYDLVSGNVKKVITDEMQYRYEYDADNRITAAFSSNNGGRHWERDAKYFYYPHGPLARVEVGHHKLQGLDYAYTLEGWLKGVNSNVLGPARDIGADANETADHIHGNVATDEFGFTLGYHRADYRPIGIQMSGDIVHADNFEADIIGSGFAADAPDLYNGNISRMVTSVAALIDGTSTNPIMGMAYRYDQLNRIIEASMNEDGLDTPTNAWGSENKYDAYRTMYSYDQDGNIQKLLRFDASESPIDSLTYFYEDFGTVKKSGNRQNRLNYVRDSAGSSGNDIDNQTIGNYAYDAIGNLVKDTKGEIASITWTPTGKVSTIARTGVSTKPDLEFQYDALGNRVAKIAKPKDGSGDLLPMDQWDFTYYLRDAQGNVLSTFQRQFESNGGGNYTDRLLCKERILYGSTRLGLDYTTDKTYAISPNREYSYDFDNDGPLIDLDHVLEYSMEYTPPDPNANLTIVARGHRYYELSNHLGNVLATVSDLRTAVDNSGTIASYRARVHSAQAYHPFGLQLDHPLTVAPSSVYRFGFGGHEEVDEVSGSGNVVDMGDRWLDVRIGRTAKPDRKGTMYPGISPYTFAANNPIYSTDPDGQVIEPYTKKWGYGWLSWTTYPYFTGGFTGSQGEVFHKVKTSMVGSSEIFKKVYNQLENSSSYFRFTETDITQDGVKGGMSKNNPEANGYFQSSHAGTKEDPFIINFNLEKLKGISGHNNTSTIFEETFHAGQTDYYGSNKPSGIDIEVEAKVAKAIEGYNTEFSYEGFDNFRTAFKNGTATNQQLINFEIAVLDYAKSVSNTYINYKMSKGSSRVDAEKSYGMGAFTGNFKYAESLYEKEMKAEGAEIVAPKN